MRGGNSRHTRNFRCMHESATGVLTGAYCAEEYFEDLIRVTEGVTDRRLAEMTIARTPDAYRFMLEHGVQFQKALSGTLSLSRSNAFFLGGGKALVNAYYLCCERLGVRVLYDTEVLEIPIQDGEVRRLTVARNKEVFTLEAQSIVVASGGYQANIEWLKEGWGECAERFVVRGTPYAQGRVLRRLLEQNVESVGDPRQCHAVAVDARAPKFDGGIVTRIDCIPFSVVVNRDGKRFYDEGEDIWPKRYAIWGRLVAMQPGQIAYTIIDDKCRDLFMPTAFAPFIGQTLEDLARQIDVPAVSLRATLDEFNAAIQPGRFNSNELDECRTRDIAPPKSHWARTIDRPPFCAFPLHPGITFTYLGVKVDEHARVRMRDGTPLRNLFATGEIMAGSLLGKGYLAGFGMAIGTVFGRIAGKEASLAAGCGGR
jgi:tricarballylate dehydrogenase